METLEKIERIKPGRSFFLLGAIIVLIILAAFALFRLLEREYPQLSVLTDLSRVGLERQVEVVFSDGRSGLRDVSVRMVQEGRETVVFERSYPRIGTLKISGPARARESFLLNTRGAGFRDGEAELVVTIHDYSWWGFLRGNEAVLTLPVKVDTRPPLVAILDSPRYIIPGGSGIVVYKVGEELLSHGVVINGFKHPGFPLPQRGEGVYGAMIGLPYDTKALSEVAVTASDLAGNQTVRPFGMILRKKTLREDQIRVTDGFLEMKLPEFNHYFPELAGSTPLEKYLEVNNRVRRENAAAIRGICQKSRPDKLWDGRFNRLPRSVRRAGFAEARTYLYRGEEIDHQVHLGIDLASTRQAEVYPANRGEVVFTDYLGIYGNMVVIDHGMGIFTLYSHLSQINCSVGDLVDKKSVIALTGATGMAGGDHLHFSVLINGIFVNPLEWWDKQWMDLNINQFLRSS